MLFGDAKKWYKLLSIVIDAYICGGYFCSILNVAVTSRAGVRIEMFSSCGIAATHLVTSRAGVRIEILKCLTKQTFS